jgi:hypothetical protein
MSFEAIIKAEMKRRCSGEEKEGTERYRRVEASTVESVGHEVGKKAERSNQ